MKYEELNGIYILRHVPVFLKMSYFRENRFKLHVKYEFYWTDMNQN
jgi:hypothetical protein